MISKNDKKEIVRKSGFTDISLVNRGSVLGLYESTSISVWQIAELVKIGKSRVSRIIRMQKTLGEVQRQQSQLVRRTTGEPIRESHIQQTPKHPDKLM